MKSIRLPIIALLLSLFTLTYGVQAETKTICIRDSVRVKSGRIKLSSNVITISGSECPKGFSAIFDMDDSPNEDPDEDEDEPELIYGDESSGDLNITQDFTLLDPNRQYRNITIESGRTLTVPSGTTLRCTGEFLNSGSILVSHYASGGVRDDGPQGQIITQSPQPGLSKGAAVDGEIGDNTHDVLGGDSDPTALTEAEARSMLRPGPLGGGGGGAGSPFSHPGGGKGGGSLTVLCKGVVRNGTIGVIKANGHYGSSFGGSGGGAGGIVILASKTRVDNQGLIETRGGEGAENNYSTNQMATATGGGGGGGIIHLISKSIFQGVTNVSGGSAGFGNGGVLTSNPRGGGGQGGSLGGNGGAGASVSPSGLISGAEAGGAGLVLETSVDPATLF